jgi:hypothetical protein
VHLLGPLPAAINIVWISFGGHETAVNEATANPCGVEVLDRTPKSLKQAAAAWRRGKDRFDLFESSGMHARRQLTDGIRGRNHPARSSALWEHAIMI